MSITIQAKFNSAVERANKDVFTRSYIEGNTTIIEFDMRKRNYKHHIYWRKENYHIDIHEFSLFHSPVIYRFCVSQGYYLDDERKRTYFTPKIKGVSTFHHMSNSAIYIACFLAVVCGVSLRNISLIYKHIFLIPVTKSTIKRWIDNVGENLPSEEEIVKLLITHKKPVECHIDGYYPRGTDNCVIVVKDEYDRILLTHEAESENKEDAKLFLSKIKDMGLEIKSSFSDYSKSFIEALKEVFPNAKFQADHFHTTKNIWKYLKKSLLEHRRKVKENGENENNDQLISIAKKMWKLRWTLLKKPSSLSEDEKTSIEELEKNDQFISKFRAIIRQVVNIFDHSNTEIQAKTKLKQLKFQIEKMESSYLLKISKFFDDHWIEAMQYLRKRGLAKHRRSSNSESGMRILRRLEKNHDGIRSERTRKNYIKIYQMIKYLSKDVTDFISGPTIIPSEGKNHNEAHRV